MHEDLAAGHPLLDVVHLRLHRGQVVLGAALQHELAARGRPAAALPDHVLPDVLGQHLGQAREQLLLGEALLLEVHPVGVEEHGAAVAELGRQLRLEGRVGVLGDREAELVGHRLQQHAVAGRALVGELEGLDVAVLHEQDLDVLAADVADDVDVAEIVHRAHHVGDRLDDVHVGACSALLEHVRRVAGRAEADDLQRGALRLCTRRRSAAEQVLGVLDRVALTRGCRLFIRMSPCSSSSTPWTRCCRRRGRSPRARPEPARTWPASSNLGIR